MTIKDKEKLAYRMRTSRKYLDEAYLKIFPIEQEAQQNQDYEARPLARETDAKIINVVPLQDKLPAYQSKLTRNKKYYDENKDKVLKKQKEYKDNRPAYEKARVRLLHYLNNDASYIDRMKDATRQKYDFKKENGKWI